MTTSLSLLDFNVIVLNVLVLVVSTSRYLPFIEEIIYPQVPILGSKDVLVGEGVAGCEVVICVIGTCSESSAGAEDVVTEGDDPVLTSF